MGGRFRDKNTSDFILQLHGVGKRLVGALCCTFLKNTKFATLATEKWMPYTNWAENILQYKDVIITFNYDLVIEKLKQRKWNSENTKNNVLALHGWIDYKRNEQNGNTVFKETSDEHFILTCEDSEIGIATPGQTKLKISRELDNLWINTQRNLSEASVIVFVGYRFPVTDIFARQRIIDAISINDQDNLKIHLVLGLDDQKAIDRLEQLLIFAAAQRKRKENKSTEIIKHSLYAEDFLSLVNNDMLYNVDFPNKRIV